MPKALINVTILGCPVMSAPPAKGIFTAALILAAMGVILVPYDGSVLAQKALEKAADLAGEGDTVLVLHVKVELADFGVSVGGGGSEQGEGPADEQGMVDAAVELLRKRGRAAMGEVRTGKIVEEILKEAQERRCATIVIGSTGKGNEKIGQFRLGSVADKVARQAPCPVLIVR